MCIGTRSYSTPPLEGSQQGALHKKDNSPVTLHQRYIENRMMIPFEGNKNSGEAKEAKPRDSNATTSLEAMKARVKPNQGRPWGSFRPLPSEVVGLQSPCKRRLWP